MSTSFKLQEGDIVHVKSKEPAKPQTLTNLALYPDENGGMWLVGGTPDNFHATNIKTKETRLFEDENGLLTTGDQLQLDGRQLASVKHESIEDITLRKGDVVQAIEDNQVYTGVVIDDNYNDVTPILVVYGYSLMAPYTAKGYSDYFERRRAITCRLGHFEHFDKI